ncbi:MAG: RNA-binding S4 domain-containing protein [Gemmatimonadota bacterium]
MTDGAGKSVRFDRWLWAARLFKTRALAAQAIAGGKAIVNTRRAKPAHPLRIGDAVRVRKGPFVHELVVRGLADRRGPTREAAALYEESPASRQARETLALQLAALPQATHDGRGRPTKKARRELERLRRQEPA